MNRLLIAGIVIALSGSGCAGLKGGLKAPSKADMEAAAAKAKELADKVSKAQEAANIAIKNCPAKDGNIPLVEEKGAGGAIMVALANKSGDFLVQPELPEVDAKPEKVKVDMKNPRNSVIMYVAKVGKLLASYSTRPELPWVFGVVENDGVNAFSAPGGYVVVTTGLLRLVENEAQLAAVLGHEIGHVVNKDVIKTYAGVKHNICVPAVTVAAYIQYGIADQLPADVQENGKFAKDFDGTNGGKMSSGLIEALTKGVLKFIDTFGLAKDQEYDADRVGFELMMFAGYDTAEFDKMLAKAQAASKVFSNHPSNDDRVKEIVNLRSGVKKEDGTFEEGKEGYSMFGTGGVVPAVPADVKANVPAEGTAKPRAPATEPAKDTAAATPKA